MNITLVGTGRAGSALACALASVGHHVTTLHHDELDRLGPCDAVVLCVPDDAVAGVAQSLEVSDARALIHLAGSRGLDELAPHRRVGLMHPLAILCDDEEGANRLIGARYAVAGDEVVGAIVASLGGRAIYLRSDQRASYHACAAVAANHVVALLGHVQSLAESAGLTFEDFLPLAEQALADVRRVGVARALTGPASRADMATIDAHLAAMPPSERPTYVALANAAFDLAERRRVGVRA